MNPELITVCLCSPLSTEVKLCWVFQLIILVFRPSNLLLIQSVDCNQLKLVSVIHILKKLNVETHQHLSV